MLPFMSFSHETADGIASLLTTGSLPPFGSRFILIYRLITLGIALSVVSQLATLGRVKKWQQQRLGKP
jgi:hypothetical protein